MADNLDKDLAKLKIDRSTNQGFALPGRWVFFAIIGLAAVFLAFFFLKSSLVPKKQLSLMTVHTQSPLQRSVLMTSGGYVVAESEITVSSKVAGTIESLNVREGDQVKKGDILAILDNAALLVRMEEAAATRQQARLNLIHKKELYAKDAADLKRRRELFNKRIISPSQLDMEEKNLVLAKLELDRAQSELEVCEKKLNLTKIRLNESTIRAPISGTVIERLADPGEMLFPMKTMEGKSGSAVVTLANLNVMNVEIDINEDDIEKVELGNPVLINPDSFPARTYRGEVIEISPMADRHKNVVPVKVRIENPDHYLKPDMSAKVTFQKKGEDGKETAPVIRIPISSVLKKNGKTFVVLMENGEIRQREVQLGTIEGTHAIVEAGLDDGERIVLEGHAVTDAGTRR